MAGITIHGIVPISTLDSRERTSVLTDSGTIEAGLTISGRTTGVSLAVAREYDRLLQELAWYSRHAGGCHIASTDHSIDDGLYELRDVRTSATPETSKTNLFQVSMTLRRLGGGSGLGSNVARQLRAQTTLTSNSYSITSTIRNGLPSGATALDVTASATRSTEDGNISLYASAPRYAFSGSGYNKGECKVFDTRGDATESNWQRVFSPDHTFSDPAHFVMQNGLIRITGNSTAGHLGRHRIYVWTGAAYTDVAGTQGDMLYDGAVPALAPVTIDIAHLGPDRIQVTFELTSSSSPGARFTKTITMYRGKPLAKFALTRASAGTLRLGLGSGTWVFCKGSPLDGSGDMQRPAFDDGVESGVPAINAPEDNWMASFTTKSSSTGTLGIIAWASSGKTYAAVDGGGMYYEETSVTTITAWLGGVKYNTSSAQLEAEAGTLTGGATAVSTISGASGGGNNQVRLSVSADQVDMATNLASIGGSTVLVLFRLAITSAAGGTDVDLIIRNSTAGSNLASVTRDETHFAAINTWYWQAVVGTGWNGTDTLVARANLTFDLGGDIHIDQCIAVAIAGGSAEMFVDDVAGQALTESIVAAVAMRQIY